jgi:hypothetical protein
MDGTYRENIRRETASHAREMSHTDSAAEQYNSLVIERA